MGQAKPFQHFLGVTLLLAGHALFGLLLWWELGDELVTRAPAFLTYLYHFGGKAVPACILWGLGGIIMLTASRGWLTLSISLLAVLSVPAVLVYEERVAEGIAQYTGTERDRETVSGPEAGAQGNNPQVDGQVVSSERLAAGTLPFRTFQDQRGNTIRARLIAFDGTKVTIEREDGQTFANPVTIYSEADQEYIRTHSQP